MAQSSVMSSSDKKAKVETASSYESNNSQLIAEIGRDLSISCLMRCGRWDYEAVSAVNKSFQEVVRSGEVYKVRRESGIVEHWVYFSSNIMEWEAFDPTNRRWVQVPKMPFESCFAHADKESLAVGTQLLVFGREIMAPAIYRYSLLNKKWTTKNEPMQNPRCMFASSAAGAVAYVAGGCSPTGETLKSAEVYDSEKGTWRSIPSMKTARRACSGVFMDGKFYVVGGTTGDGKALATAEAYDPVKKTWEEIEGMYPRAVEAGESPPLVAVVKNEMYAADPGKMEVMKYVKGRNVWVRLGRMPERVGTSKGWGVAFRGCGDRLLVIGGISDGAGGGTLQVNSWVPPAATGDDNVAAAVNGDEGALGWEVIATKRIGTFVYNCAVMGC